MPRRGAWTTEGDHDYSSPHPLGWLVKLKKEEHRFSICLSILLFNYIVLITIIWQNLGGRKGRAYAPWVAGSLGGPPRVAVSLGGPPRVAVSLEATLH